jgi:hypothetical protein
MKAERLLIQKALLDPDNQRFVLLSESCIPLYPPQTVYQQLMAESRSRINGCRNWRGTDDHIDRCVLLPPSESLMPHSISARALHPACSWCTSS